MKILALIMIVIGVLGAGGVYAQTFTLKSDTLGGQLTEAQVFSGFGCRRKKHLTPSQMDECTCGDKELCGDRL